MSIKTCPSCKSLGPFFKNASKHDGLSTHCKKCHTLGTLARRAKNKEQYNKTQRMRRAKNPEYFRQLTNKWAKENSWKKNAINRKRYATKLNATPTWLTEDDIYRIECFYVASKFLSMAFGVEIEVDHIVPLKGEQVNGLHVPWNLQLLPAVVNASKGNRV